MTNTHTHTSAPKRGWPVLTLVFLWLLSALCAKAQPTGSISGRVYNPVSQQYVANAEVSVQGTLLTVSTESDGSYLLVNVPTGGITLRVNYTGYRTAPVTLELAPGQAATHDFELRSTQPQTLAESDTPLALEKMIVYSEREGNAKAIMEQKSNMNITTSVASDIFGNVTDGNVGEFLKFLPGVDIDYVESEARGVRLGGMEAQYTAVTFDGVRLSSADAGRTGELARATSFEALSISSIESIEINRTTSSDMDADAPAGSINMKSRRASDRQGRRISYNASLNLNSEAFTLSKTYGPSSRKEYKARPNFSLEYSDVLLNQRLGVVASINHVDSYTEQYRENLSYNTSSSAADPRPFVIRRLNFKNGAKSIGKDTYTLRTDFKATPNLTLSNNFIYNYSEGESYNREVNFDSSSNNDRAGTGRQTVLGDGVTTLTTVDTNSNRNQAIVGTNFNKRTSTVTVYPRVEYKLNSWVIDGGGAYSRSANTYGSLSRGLTRTEESSGIVGGWTASRPDRTSHEWTIQQISGPDWFNLANRTNTRITDDGRAARSEHYTGDLNAKWITPLRRFPTWIKFGGKSSEVNRKNQDSTPFNSWGYIGPGGNILTGYNPTTGAPIFTTTGSWAGFVSPTVWDTGTPNLLTTKSISGDVRSIPRPDPNAIAAMFQAHPEYFVRTTNADNYYNAYIASNRNITETITAGYGMADIRFSKQLQVQTGLRWEKTELDALEFDPLNDTQMAAGGFPVYSINPVTGKKTTLPTTITGYQYQYFTKPRVHRKNDYENFFPMISAKYTIHRNLQFHAGFNQAISRPSTDSLSGAWEFDYDNQIITIPNPDLLPEYSRNYVSRLAYYFEPAGLLSVTAAQNDIRNSWDRLDIPALDFGVEDPIYNSYRVRVRTNAEKPVRYRSIEYAYSQTLPFQAEALRGITVNLAYTHVYIQSSDNKRRSNLPHRVTSNLGYRYRRLSARLGVVWRDDAPQSTIGEYRLHDTKYDLGGEFVITKNLSFYFQGRNIFNDGVTSMSTPPGLPEGQNAALRTYENYGANWNFGIKGSF